MTAYERGVHFEKRVSAYLRADGYFCIESRGSHGPVDVLAVKKGQILAVQAKTDGAISIADWNELRTLALLGMVPILACREGRKLVLWELYGPRVKFDRNPPKRLFVTDQVAAA